MCKRLANVCAYSCFCLFTSELAFSIDESRLWLPSNHETLYLDLKRSAEAAEALERCEAVIRGTVDFVESKAYGNTVFKILCRQNNGRTYSELVDGITFETLTTKIIKEVPLTEEELEAKRLEEERKRLEEIERSKSEFLRLCMTAFELKTRLFINLELLEETPEPEELSLEEAKFYLDFNAKDVNDMALKYRAICVVGVASSPQLYIRKRRE